MVKPEIAVVGSANVDLMFTVPELVHPGETIAASGFQRLPGGKGANQAVAAARLGGQVAFIGKVGADSDGEWIRQCLCNEEVDTDYLERVPDTSTGLASIAVDAKGQNAITVFAGANGLVDPEGVSRALGALCPRVVIAQMEIPVSAVAACVGNWFFILNPAPAHTAALELASTVDLVTPNETEAEALTGIYPEDDASSRAAARKLLDLGFRSAVITLGGRGCFVFADGHEEHIPPHAVVPVDTTGAGDAFNGALAVFISQRKPILEATKLANICAALSTTKVGAQGGMVTRAVLDQFIDRTPKT